MTAWLNVGRNALLEWITVKSIVKTAVQAGVLTPTGFDLLQRQLVAATEPEVRALLSAFLQSRKVRQAVARHMAKVHGSDRRQAMASLFAMADVSRG